jgi:hypothetical protein
MSGPVHYSGKFFPPYSPAVSRLQPTSGGTRTKKFLMMLSVAAVAGVILSAILSGITHGAAYIPYPGIGLVLLIFLVMLPSVLKAKQAACPYCGRMVGTSASTSINMNDERVQVECPYCFEWLISDQGELRAFRPEDAGDKKEFKCPAFVNGFWPQECIVCGAQATRLLAAKQTKMQVAKLLVEKISVTTASISSIPYCNEYADAVSVDVSRDYAARRRYLNANQQRVVMKTK